MSEAAPRSSEILRPRDAATLIIVRRGKNGGEVLMGERSAAHVFVPENYVFPGGRVDRSDAFVQPATPLRPDVLERLSRSATPRRALALAMAAVRETFEETGLVVGRPVETPKTLRRTPKRSEEHTSELQSLMRISYAVFCLKKKKKT